MIKWRALLFGPLALGGCATPQPLLDLAGQGAATATLAQASLRDYLALAESQLNARLDLLLLEQEQDVRDRAGREQRSAIDRRMGVTARDDAAELIRGLGKESREIREREALELQNISQTAKLDIAALGKGPTERLAAANRGFQVLAQELSAREWLALGAAYAKEIRAGVQKLQSSLKERDK